MPTRAYYEALWKDLPEGLTPAAFQLRLRFLLEHVQPGQHVLDLGCGEGAFAGELLRAGAEVVATDVAEEPLRRARARHAGLETRLIEPAGPWDLPGAGFDVVWAGEVIEHVADTAAWMSELRRVLRSGGTLLLTTPAHGRGARLRLAFSNSAFAEHFDPLTDRLRFYSARTLTALIGEYGFQSVEAVSAGAGAWLSSASCFQRGRRSSVLRLRRPLTDRPTAGRPLLLAKAVRSRF